MFKLTDSGCRQHRPRQIALTGAAATLVGHLVVNLPVTDGSHSYICDHGYTHYVRLECCDPQVSPSPPELGYGRDKACTH